MQSQFFKFFNCVFLKRTSFVEGGFFYKCRLAPSAQTRWGPLGGGWVGFLPPKGAGKDKLAFGSFLKNWKLLHFLFSFVFAFFTPPHPVPWGPNAAKPLWVGRFSKRVLFFFEKLEALHQEVFQPLKRAAPLRVCLCPPAWRGAGLPAGVTNCSMQFVATRAILLWAKMKID